ncbi:histidine kinase [Planomonospora parontospora subsp. parontospora]|uniref:Histidine kinase n=3 Tax=Planomonospora parontospora TaxID=58119 RepID=A0AA37BPK5_9ACTN|nr:histidine kinase [Planomonospora parontospora]GII13098.1 histidine kinase [Planomonospora parontospora subsp. parontospora]
MAQPDEAATRMHEPPLTEAVEDDFGDLYEHAPFGYLSTLMDGTIVRANATFLTMAGRTRADLVGRVRFPALLPVGDRIFYDTHFAPLLAMQGEVREIAVELRRPDGTRLPVLVNAVVKPAAEGRPAVIRLSAVAATDRRRYERELLRERQRAERSEAEARHLAQILQASFVPAALPAVPGLDVAGVYRPAGSGDEVGGDFYDLFETAHGWGMSLGDVCGKGARAAVVTSLARYTLRAAGIRDARPAEVLSLLNQALLRERTDRFLTAAYARIHHDGAGRPRLKLSLGGHPPPVRISREHPSGPVGRPGDLLGVFDDPKLRETEVELSPGDVLLFYTDGITEGRGADGVMFGEERLRRSLEAARGADAQGVAEHLVDEVVDFQSGLPIDDIAVLVLRVPD